MVHPDRQEFAETTSGGLTSYLPAVEYAVRLARQREKKMADRFEPIGLEDAREARRELEALVEAIGGPTT